MTFLQRHFRLYNRRYFGNRLPQVPVYWKKRPWYYGLCYPDRIHINHSLSRFHKHALLVLLHEMIHLKLGKKAGHGLRFQKETVRLARLGALKDLF